MVKITTEYTSEDVKHIKVTLEQDGIVQQKTIQFSDYKAAILSSTAKEGVLFRLEKMGESYIDGIYDVSEPLTGRLAFFVKGQQQVMYFNGNKDGGMVPYPSLVFFFLVKKGRIQKTLVFAVKAKRKEDIKEDTPLFIYPYGNVSTYNGTVCWGGNKLDEIKSFRELEKYIRLFFYSPTNKDHYNPGESVLPKIELPELIQRMKQRKSFDNSLLKKANYTFENCLLKGGDW